MVKFMKQTLSNEDDTLRGRLYIFQFEDKQYLTCIVIEKKDLFAEYPNNHKHKKFVYFDDCLGMAFVQLHDLHLTNNIIYHDDELYDIGDDVITITKLMSSLNNCDPEQLKQCDDDYNETMEYTKELYDGIKLDLEKLPFDYYDVDYGYILK